VWKNLDDLCELAYTKKYEFLSIKQSLVVAGKPRDAAAILFGLKFADNIH